MTDEAITEEAMKTGLVARRWVYEVECQAVAEAGERGSRWEFEGEDESAHFSQRHALHPEDVDGEGVPVGFKESPGYGEGPFDGDQGGVVEIDVDDQADQLRRVGSPAYFPLHNIRYGQSVGELLVGDQGVVGAAGGEGKEKEEEKAGIHGFWVALDGSMW
jgi:hypothetical protein